jgi:hypothetical protein
MRTTRSGATPKVTRRGFAGHMANLLALAGGELVIRDARGQWLESRDGGASWAPASNGFEVLASAAEPPGLPSGQTWCSVHRSPARSATLVAGCTWANGVHPSTTCFHWSHDGGRTWAPPRQAGAAASEQCRAPGLPASWSVTAVLLDATDPQRMLAAWMAGGVYRTDDGGQTWQQSDEGLRFRKQTETEIDWIAIGETPLIRAVLLRDGQLLAAALAEGADINDPGIRLGGVLAADLLVQDLERKQGTTASRGMWHQLRRLGATSLRQSAPHASETWLQNTIEWGTIDLAADLILLGYPWEKELSNLLDLPEDRRPRTALWLQLVDAYPRSARFEAADQVAAAFLAAGRRDLAIRVLRAATRRMPFDRQAVRNPEARVSVAAHLLRQGDSVLARRVFATLDRAEVDALDDTMRLQEALGSTCDVREGDWYQRQGVPVRWALDYAGCLSDRRPMQQRLRVLRAIEARGGIPPEAWTLWLDSKETTWLKAMPRYASDRKRGESLAGGRVGMWIAHGAGSRGMTVAAVVPGSAAHAGGILAGDELVAIDGREVAGRTLDQLGQDLAGAPGSNVLVSVRRGGVPMVFTFGLTRIGPAGR